MLWPYINEVVKRTEELGVKLHMVKGNHVIYNGDEVSGFFNDVPEPILAFHLEGPTAEQVLYHESQHMEQWHEKAKVWRDMKLTPLIDTEDMVFFWVNKRIELTPAQLKEYVQRSINLELDCEKRTAKLVRRLRRVGKTEVDVGDYIQKANSYVMFWHMVAKTRQWYEIGKRPYELPEVYGEFPTTLSMNYERLPKKYERLFEEHCF